MKILPAIDLKDGQCVRLKKGDYATAYKVAENAVATAKEFLRAGAEMIHMVDLDGAKDGAHINYEVVRRVIIETGATVELGGGIRSMEDIKQVLELGVERVIIGSAAVQNPELVKLACQVYGEQIAIGIDALSGTVRTDGWIKDSNIDYLELAQQMESNGVKVIIFTDINKDGMLEGPNLQQLSALRQTVNCKIIASGGVSTLDDIQRLKGIGVEGAIVGKAVYTGALSLADAIREAR